LEIPDHRALGAILDQEIICVLPGLYCRSTANLSGDPLPHDLKFLNHSVISMSDVSFVVGSYEHTPLRVIVPCSWVTPESGQTTDTSTCPLCAISGHNAVQQNALLLDRFVAAREYGRGNIEAERLCEGAPVAWTNSDFNSDG
jgi:hypothetical protein